MKVKTLIPFRDYEEKETRILGEVFVCEDKKAKQLIKEGKVKKFVELSSENETNNSNVETMDKLEANDEQEKK